MKEPHILSERLNIAEYALLPGDPARAKYIAKEYLDCTKFVASNREFSTYTGTYKKIPITVTSTGIGCPSTAIAVEELINCGAKTLIRVGTCGGSLKKTITEGSIIIPTASIREEGTTREYIPDSFPAVADWEVISALVSSAQKRSVNYAVGINRTHDAFYGQSRNIQRWGSPYTDPRMSFWEYPLISSEMESSAVFVIAMMRGVRAGAVLAVNSTPEPLQEIVAKRFKFTVPNTKNESKEAKLSVDRAILTALDAIVSLNDCRFERR